MDCPKTEAELAQLITDAQAPLAIQGGGSQGVAVQGHPVSVRDMSGVELYEPGALTLVAKAGTPVEEVQALLAQEGQQLAFEPRDLRGLMGTDGAPTLGGAFAANQSGPRRIQGGAARDYLLGVRFVDGTGQVVKNGGRVMKNVTGYDLVKLMAGAHGTLGVLSEVSLKVLPRAVATGTVQIAGLDAQQAVQAMARALGSPFDVTGAAHGAWGADDTPLTLIRVEGFADSVTYRTAELQKLLAGFGPAEVEADPDIWQRVRDVSPFHDTSGAVWRISVKPSDAPAVLDRLAPEQALLDWGGGLIWARMGAGRDVRAALGDIAGHATLIRGTGAPRFHPEPAPVAALSAGLRARFDPRAILNTGLMG